MRRYLLDSGIAGDYINRRQPVDGEVREAFLRGDRIGIGTPVLGELLGGIECGITRERNLLRLRHSLSRLRMGRPMQQIDVQTAALAFSLGNCTVVSADSDFAAIPGLDVVDWSKKPQA